MSIISIILIYNTYQFWKWFQNKRSKLKIRFSSKTWYFWRRFTRWYHRYKLIRLDWNPILTYLLKMYFWFNIQPNNSEKYFSDMCTANLGTSFLILVVIWWDCGPEDEISQTFWHPDLDPRLIEKKLFHHLNSYTHIADTSI